MNSLKNKAVFLDRDGVINHKAPEGDYITNWREIDFISGAVDAVADLNRAGYRVFIVTNQRGVATRKIKKEDLLEIHERIKEEFAHGGALISEIYYCPHDISAKCSCRKPQPGMLRRAAREHSLNLNASWMIGDSVTDVEAGDNAGCRTVLLTSGNPDALRWSKTTLLAHDLALAVRRILRFNGLGSSSVQRLPLEFSRSSFS
jgi:D-glycero-D-manno-heptose 1,7-bisphosphate phosphatase